MLFRLLKKISKNLGVFSALFLGIILSLVVINSTIIYGNVLKDSLVQKIIRNYEEDKKNETVGAITVYKNDTYFKEGFSRTFDEENRSKIKGFDKEVEKGRTVARVKKCVFWYEESDLEEPMNFCGDFKLTAIKNFKEHVDIVQGRIYSDSFKHEDKNILEVVVDRATMIDLKLEIDKLYRMEVVDFYDEFTINYEIDKGKQNNRYNYFKVVGVYLYKENDVFWRKGLLENEHNEFMASDSAVDLMLCKEMRKVNISSEYFLDLSEFKYRDLNDFENKLNIVKDSFTKENLTVDTNLGILLKEEKKNFKLVGNMLWIIQIPMLAILILYVLMITGIIVDRDKDEISLLKSRGASRGKILINYVFDGVMILFCGLLISPMLSLSVAKLMSKTSGFMEFQGISTQHTYLSMDNVYVTIATGVIFLGALIIPVLKATKVGIIDRKTSKVRIMFSTWKKTFIDFILIILGFYGLNMFKKSQEIVRILDSNINEITLDPVIFLSATVLTFGFSLFFLRIYPYLIKITLRVFKNMMPPNIFVLFANLSRKAGKREYVMLFIMIFISSSIFNLKIARTINSNIIDNAKYSMGAEVRMKGFWKADENRIRNGGNKLSDIISNTEKIEPDFSQYEKIESFESVTKVMEIKDVGISNNFTEFDRVDVMAIEPKKFGETSFLRRDLTPIHWYNYLNILAKEPRVVFLSKNIEKSPKNNIKIGDLIQVNVYGFKESFVFGGYVEYWPGTPYKSKKLLIGNFDYFYSRVARVPYEVWGKLKMNKSENELKKELNEKSIKLFEFDSISEYTKENIFLRAVNASITISFILTMIVTLLGFLIYWCICIRERELQFGILRSLGMKKRKVYTMIVLEQIFVTGIAILGGVKIGQFISSRFLSIVTEIVFGNTMLLPTLEYITSRDYLLIVAVFIVSIAFVLSIILKYISGMELGQAVKIGED